MTAKNQPADEIASLSFEQAMKEMEQIVRKLESGNASLEESINDYTRGTALKTHCEKKLAEARMKIDKITKAENGTVKIEKFEAEE